MQWWKAIYSDVMATPPPCIKFYYVGGILEIMYSSSIHPNLYSLDTLQNVNLYFYTYLILVNIKKIVL